MIRARVFLGAVGFQTNERERAKLLGFVCVFVICKSGKTKPLNSVLCVASGEGAEPTRVSNGPENKEWPKGLVRVVLCGSSYVTLCGLAHLPTYTYYMHITRNNKIT